MGTLWSTWTELLQGALGLLASQGGLSQALAIITLTLLARAALLPLSLASAVRAQRNKEAMARLQPELGRLKDALKDDPLELNRRTLALYREHGVKVMDRLSLLNLLGQSAFGIGLYQTLQRISLGGKFLWIASLAKPDVWVTLLVGVLMAVSLLLTPGIADQPVWLLALMGVPLLISLFAVAALPSAVGIYWATSNFASLVQGLLLRAWLMRRPQATIAG
jgi:YidC/Oxa1 family membrane protein insertase